MILVFTYRSKNGTVYIGREEGRYHPLFDGDSLGNYATAEQAAEDLAGGHVFSHRSGVDFAKAGIPHELERWTPVRART